MGYPAVPLNCRRELQSTRYLSLKFRVSVFVCACVSFRVFRVCLTPPYSFVPVRRSSRRRQRPKKLSVNWSDPVYEYV